MELVLLAAEQRLTSEATWTPPSWMLHCRGFLYPEDMGENQELVLVSVLSQRSQAVLQWCATLRLAEASSALVPST